MPEYLIHTFGGGELLADVFNAIARICGGQDTYLSSLSKFAMSIGTIYMGCRAILKAQVGELFGPTWFMPTLGLFLLFFTPKTTVWIKDEVKIGQHKVDNVPFGIAFVGSVSSEIGFKVARFIEDQMLPVGNTSIGYTRSNGVLFGAKAITKMREMQIENPLLLRNVKEMMRQCFIKPYVIGNITGKKYQAMSTRDILSFMKANPINNFGIYYTDSNRVVSFKTCQQTVSQIEQDFNTEQGMITQFANLLGLPDASDQLNTRLTTVVGNTLTHLQRGQANVNDWMKQAMMLNAHRASYDDWREEKKLSRIHPELVNMNATRGVFQQAWGWIISGEMASSILPSAQSGLFAFLICAVIFIQPLSMIPGGLNIFKTWLLLNIWVNLWPIGFAISHCLGQISLSKNTALANCGFDLMSQGRFADIILTDYAFYQFLAASTPAIMWALFKGCTYGFTSLAQSVSPLSSGQELGRNMADNNLSMGNINYGNTSINQKQHAPSLSYGGGFIDDGGMRVTTTEQGNQIIAQPVDNLPTNFKASETMMDSLTQSISHLTSVSDRQAKSLASSIMRGEASINGIGDSEMQALKENLSKGQSASDGFSDRDNKCTTTGSKVDTSVGVEGSTGKLLPIKLKGSLTATSGTSANNTSSQGKEMTAQEQESYNQALSKVKQAAKSHNINTTVDSSKRLSDDLAKTLDKVDSFTAQRSHTMQNQAQIDRNFNAAVLSEIQEREHLPSKASAARWIEEHPNEVSSIAHDVMGSKKFDLAGAKANLINKYEQASNNLEQSATIKDDTGQEVSMAKHVKNQLQTDKMMYNSNVGEVLQSTLNEQDRSQFETLNKVQDNVSNKQKKVKDKYDNTSKSTIVRTAKQPFKNAKEIIKDAKELIKG